MLWKNLMHFLAHVQGNRFILMQLAFAVYLQKWSKRSPRFFGPAWLTTDFCGVIQGLTNEDKCVGSLFPNFSIFCYRDAPGN